MRRLQQQNIYMIFLFCTKHHNTTTQKPHDTNLIIAILFLSLSLALSLALSLSLSLSLFDYFVQFSNTVIYLLHICILFHILSVFVFLSRHGSGKKNHRRSLPRVRVYFRVRPFSYTLRQAMFSLQALLAKFGTTLGLLASVQRFTSRKGLKGIPYPIYLQIQGFQLRLEVGSGTGPLLCPFTQFRNQPRLYTIVAWQLLHKLVK